MRKQLAFWAGSSERYDDSDLTIGDTMRLCACIVAMLLAAAALAQPDGGLPKLVALKQAAKPRPHPKLKLPKNHTVGPTIPGLLQGAVPQGLAYWKAQNWLLISSYFKNEDRPSVVVALDARSGEMVRCLTLVGAAGKAHTGHVGGLAVSDRHLWVGSGQLFRAPLAELLAARPNDYLRLEKLFHAECDASFVSYHDGRVWVGEFVAPKDPKYKAEPGHVMKDLDGDKFYAWAAGYALDAGDNLKGAAGGKVPPPQAIFAIPVHAQGMAFLDDRVIVSTSFGRSNDSALVSFPNPLAGSAKTGAARKPDEMVKVKAGEGRVPFWFLGGKKKDVKRFDFPPMAEGITAVGDRLAVITESGAKAYLKGGDGPLDSVIYLGR